MLTRLWLLALVGVMSVSLVAVACGDDDDDDMGGMDMGGSTMTSGPMPAATASMGHDMMASPTMGLMGSPSSALDLDLAFIDGMIPHHQSAVEMARLAEEHADHQEIKDLAADIIAAQQAEIDQMRMWRDAWFPGAAQTGGMPGMEHMAGMQMSEADMQMLRDADPFDKQFIDMMIPHHESAIAMAQEILKTTQRPELQQLANAIITAQQAEIDQMKAWRAAWYGS